MNDDPDRNLTKRELAVLEKAMQAEIDSAFTKRSPMFQTKSKLAQDLCERGYLKAVTETFGSGPFAVVCKGYAVTWKGNIVFCFSCKDKLPE